VQGWCKPSAESLLFAEVQPILARELKNSGAKVRKKIKIKEEMNKKIKKECFFLFYK
jgi:hypothetical protein